MAFFFWSRFPYAFWGSKNIVGMAIEKGQFANGSMLPKVEVALKFAESKKWRKVIIDSLDKAKLALRGEGGMIILKKIGIIICGKYQNCGGGKCFRGLTERLGGISIYPAKEQVEIVGYSYCGGCPGGNIEYVPEEMIKNGAEVIHLATGFVIGYPPCPNIAKFKEFIENHYKVPVVIGTHPIPMKYFSDHEKMSFWKEMKMNEVAPELFKDSEKTMINYN